MTFDYRFIVLEEWQKNVETERIFSHVGTKPYKELIDMSMEYLLKNR